MRTRRGSAGLLALLLIAGPLFLTGGLETAQAGPREAKALYELAKARRRGPWPAAVRAFHAVLSKANRHDDLWPRTWKALSRVYTKAGLPQAGLAALGVAARCSRTDATRVAALQLAMARSLLSELDLAAARALLWRVLEVGAARAPRETAAALGLLVEDAYERTDLRALKHLSARMAKDGAALAGRIRAAGRRGELHLLEGDRRGAERAQEEARRLYDAAATKDGQDARKAARVWLDLPLRELLAVDAKPEGR